MTRFQPTHVIWAALLATALAAAGPAAAQRQGTPQQPPQAAQPQKPQPEITEQKINAAAAAIQKVASVREDYQQKIDSAPDGEKQKLATEARDAMTKAVTEQGLSVEEYTEILVVAQNDTSVREKILQRLRGPQAQ